MDSPRHGLANLTVERNGYEFDVPGLDCDLIKTYATGEAISGNRYVEILGYDTMIWFTADTHFRHENIIRYCKRPFSSLDEMDETLLGNINASVRPDDTLYHLGDFSMRGRNAEAIRSRIRCKNVVLVVGNHDPCQSDGTAKPQFAELFSAVHTLARIKVQIARRSQLIVLCHYGMRVWDRSHYGAWHLYGHSHGKLPSIPGAIDVGVDCHDFRPINMHEVAARVEDSASETT